MATEGLADDVVQKAAEGRMHHRYINLERSEMANARSLIKALGAEIIRLKAAHNTRLPASGCGTNVDCSLTKKQMADKDVMINMRAHWPAHGICRECGEANCVEPIDVTAALDGSATQYR